MTTSYDELLQGSETYVPAPLGPCTRDPEHGQAEVPWSGERLCWDCADHELDLMAKALQAEMELPPPPTQDEMIDALARDLLSLAGGDVDKVNAILQYLGTEEAWDGNCPRGCDA